VPGAQALYFGADQPRIVTEAMLPWQALGLSAPPKSGKIKVEIAASAWLNARWMSLSGLAPKDGATQPARWTEMKLSPQ
jgi:hypothetical protein